MFNYNGRQAATMSKRKYIIGGLLVLFLAWVSLELVLNRQWFLPPPPADVQIDVSGTAGKQITANFEVDGINTQLTRTLPTSFSFPHARHVKYTVMAESMPGDLWATPIIDGARMGSTGGPCEWIRGEIKGGVVTDATCGPGQPK